MRRKATEGSSVSDNNNLNILFNSVHCFQNSTIRRWLTYYIPIIILEFFWCGIALPPLLFPYPVNECSSNGIVFSNTTCTDFRFNITTHLEYECIPDYAVPIDASNFIFILCVCFMILIILNLAILVFVGDRLLNYHEFASKAVTKYRVILQLKSKKQKIILVYLFIILFFLFLTFLVQTLAIYQIPQSVFETTCVGETVYYTIAMNNTNWLNLFISLVTLISYTKGVFMDGWKVARQGLYTEVSLQDLINTSNEYGDVFGEFPRMKTMAVSDFENLIKVALTNYPELSNKEKKQIQSLVNVPPKVEEEIALQVGNLSVN